MSGDKWDVPRHQGIQLEIVALAIVGITIMASVNIPFANNLNLADEGLIVRIYIHESGGFQPDAILVKVGETTKLTLMAMDVTHSFVIPELGIDTGPIKAGHTEVIELTPKEAGTFTIYCGVLCSPEHHLMKGKLVVTR